MSVKRSPSIQIGQLAGDTTLYTLKVLNHQLMLETYNHLKLDMEKKRSGQTKTNMCC